MHSRCPECNYEGEFQSVKIRLGGIGFHIAGSVKSLQCPKCSVVFAKRTEINIRIIVFILGIILGALVIILSLSTIR